MKKSIFILLLSLSILGIACNQNNKDVRAFTDADIQQLKMDIEKDQLWTEYVNTMHNIMRGVTSKKMYVDENLYNNPPNIASKLANVKSNDEARQVLVSSGYTEAHADLTIKWFDCIQKLQQKYPEMTQVDPKKLNLQVPMPEGYPFNAITNTEDFLDKRNAMKQ